MNKKPQILIVDDKPENLVALEVVLKDLDIQLHKAASGNEALRATLHNDFALALLDIQMPEMDGYELASILREEEKTSRLPFIFISAVYTDNLNIFKGYEKGAFSFITKPFQPEILINKVKFFIEKYQQEITLIQVNEDLKGKNMELELLNKELESFTYSVSHDLKAPLRAMDSYAAILKEDYENILNEEGRRLLNNIRKNSEKMGNLINCLLDLSRLGKKEIVKSKIDMNVLVRGVLEELCTNGIGQKLQLNIYDLPSIDGDIELLKRVFINLLSNAIKYSAKKDTPIVEVGAEVKDQESIFYVKDNGVGFDMNYKNKLFGVFQRLHDANEFEGIGIGLAIVERIVLRNGGKVWAESELNKGATFYFSLPSPPLNRIG
jgi:two-component system, sensor histidine kinase and response regulator